MTPALSSDIKAQIIERRDELIPQISAVRISGEPTLQLPMGKAYNAITNMSALTVTIGNVREVKEVRITSEATHMVITYDLGKIHPAARAGALDVLIAKIKRTIAWKIAMSELSPGTEA